MSSRTFRGIAYERLREFKRNIVKQTHWPSSKACEDGIDTAREGSLDSDIASQNAIHDEFPDRQRVEQSLLRKVDLRMSILVLIYVLNYVSRISTYWLWLII